jgi:hypothetical protein
MRATLGLVRRIAQELQTSGTYTALEGAPSHAEVKKLLTKVEETSFLAG